MERFTVLRDFGRQRSHKKPLKIIKIAPYVEENTVNSPADSGIGEYVEKNTVRSSKINLYGLPISINSTTTLAHVEMQIRSPYNKK